jgi:hypothetical protein
MLSDPSISTARSPRATAALAAFRETLEERDVSLTQDLYYQRYLGLTDAEGLTRCSTISDVRTSAPGSAPSSEGIDHGAEDRRQCHCAQG